MKHAMSLDQGLSGHGDAEVAVWLRLLPRWSLTVGLATLLLPIVLFGGIGQEAGDTAHGLEYVELLQAVRSPVLFRIGWIIDALIWLLIGGSLVKTLPRFGGQGVKQVRAVEHRAAHMPPG